MNADSLTHTAYGELPAAARSPRRLLAWSPLTWSRRARTLGALAIAFAIWGWVDVRVRGTVDPNDLGLHKTDFTVYTEAGAAFFDGRPPYEVTNPRGWGYLYPPPFAMLVAPLHAFEPRTQVLVWFAISVLMLWGCYVESLCIARRVLPAAPQNALFGPIPPAIGWAAFVAATLPALNCLQRGQVGVAKLYLLLLGFRLCIESRTLARSLAAGAVLSLPIVLKVTPLVPVAILVLAQFVASWHAPRRADGMRRTGALAGGALAGLVLSLVLLPALAIGWRTNLQHLDTWWREVAMRFDDAPGEDFAGDSSSPRNQSLANAVERLGNWADYCFGDGPNDEDPTPQRRQGKRFLMDAPVVGRVLTGVRLIAAALLVWAAIAVARRQDTLGLAAVYGMAGVSTLMLAPIARGHYYLLLLPAAMFSAAWLHRQKRRQWAVWVAVVPAVLSVAHYVLLDVTGRIGLLGIGTAAWYFAVCTALVVGTRRVPASAPIVMTPRGVTVTVERRTKRREPIPV